MSGLSVGIVGAGIGGLTAATALAKRGFRVRVYEQASHFVPRAGAGFGFSPNGQACLQSLGIDTQQHVHLFDRLVHIRKDGNVSVETDFFRQTLQRHGFTVGGCLRGDLVDTLLASLSKATKGDVLQYSHKLVAMEQDDGRVHLEFENTQEEGGPATVTAEHDLVIGADGIHSTVAQLLDIDPSPPVYSGANIYYGVIPDPDAINFEHPVLKDCNHTVIQGNAVGEFISFPAGPDDNKVMIWATTYPAEAPPPREEWGSADLSSSPDLKRVLSEIPASHPIHELASHTDASTPGRLLHFGLFFRKHKDVWSKGRTVLLGDSCHATLPYVGQGANQAIEDSVVLANCLANEKDYKEAFQAYFDKRSRRTRRVVTMANYLDKIYHLQNPFLCQLREWFFHWMIQSGAILKAAEKEIVEECPVNVREVAGTK